MSSMDEARMLLHGVLGAAERSERFFKQCKWCQLTVGGIEGNGSCVGDVGGHGCWK